MTACSPAEHLAYIERLLMMEARRTRTFERRYHEKHDSATRSWYRQFYTRRLRAVCSRRRLRQMARRYRLEDDVADMPLFAGIPNG